jgi:hypothetical protein
MLRIGFFASGVEIAVCNRRGQSLEIIDHFVFSIDYLTRWWWEIAARSMYRGSR